MQHREPSPRDVFTTKDAPVHDLLADAGLRPTRQRVALTENLFTAALHVSASDLHDRLYVADDDRRIDRPNGTIEIHNIPAAREGYDFVSIDAWQRLKPSRQPAS